jgi:hypothetical protein
MHFINYKYLDKFILKYQFNQPDTKIMNMQILINK